MKTTEDRTQEAELLPRLAPMIWLKAMQFAINMRAAVNAKPLTSTTPEPSTSDSTCKSEPEALGRC